MKKKFEIPKYFNDHKKIYSQLNLKKIDEISKLINSVGKKNGIIYTCGNGGSAYNASHYVTDWNKFIRKVNKKFMAISLCDNIGIITATANDISYEEVFLEQIKNKFTKKDLLICISGSGKSKNLIKVAKYVKKIGGKVLAIVGYDGGPLKKIATYSIHIPSFDMQVCEDVHLMIGHIIMKKICDKKY